MTMRECYGYWHILACVLLYAKMAKWIRKLAGTGSLYTDKSRIMKHKTERGFL